MPVLSSTISAKKTKICIDEELVQTQIQVASAANEINVPDPIYSCNNNEGELVREILTSYVTLNLPDHLVPW